MSLCFQYADLFDKIDVTKEGVVDWDKFASHMLLEFYEKDDRVKGATVPQWKSLKTLQRSVLKVKVRKKVKGQGRQVVKSQG